MNDYVWTPPGTDITIRWRKAGWIPPSEQEAYKAKWRHYQELPMRTLDDAGKAAYEQKLAKAAVRRIR